MLNKVTQSVLEIRAAILQILFIECPLVDGCGKKNVIHMTNVEIFLMNVNVLVIKLTKKTVDIKPFETFQ